MSADTKRTRGCRRAGCSGSVIAVNVIASGVRDEPAGSCMILQAAERHADTGSSTTHEAVGARHGSADVDQRVNVVPIGHDTFP